ncbi:MAG: hydantoinase/oxoprolinase family protein, partial [Rhodospirillaceae bacterium]|nr:hydantoinase/oxoprolinase family protein [Rhodospirillaceae bacterium]
LAADVRHDYARTVNRLVQDVDEAEAQAILEGQVAEGMATIRGEEIEIEGFEFIHEADMQFLGQSHVLRVTLPGTEIRREALQTEFERAYWSRFGVDLPEIRPVLVTLRTAAIGKRKDVSLKALVDESKRAPDLAGALKENRRVWFEEGWADTPVYDRDRLPTGVRFAGPAIVEQLDTTTVVEPDNRVEMDDDGNLIISVPISAKGYA